MQQENNRFVLRALFFEEYSDREACSVYEDIISSSTVGDVLSKFAAMLKEPSVHHALSKEVLGFELHGKGKHWMDFITNHTGKNVQISWHQVYFLNVDRDLLKGLKEAFPERAAYLKTLALGESLGL